MMMPSNVEGNETFGDNHCLGQQSMLFGPGFGKGNLTVAYTPLKTTLCDPQYKTTKVPRTVEELTEAAAKGPLVL